MKQMAIGRRSYKVTLVENVVTARRDEHYFLKYPKDTDDRHNKDNDNFIMKG